jgi:hypothetical protein
MVVIMSTQHTPGPWSVTDGHYPSFKEISGPSFKISVVMWATDLTEDDYRKRDADLHLIAAAPELLEALKLCEGNIASLLASAHPKVYGEWLTVVSAAIAKATGENK